MNIEALTIEDWKCDVKTYVFRAEVEHEDGRWVAQVPSLPGCVTEGATKEEALKTLQDAAQVCLKAMKEHGDPLSEEAQQEVTVIDSPDIVAVTV